MAESSAAGRKCPTPIKILSARSARSSSCSAAYSYKYVFCRTNQILCWILPFWTASVFISGHFVWKKTCKELVKKSSSMVCSCVCVTMYFCVFRILRKSTPLVFHFQIYGIRVVKFYCKFEFCSFLIQQNFVIVFYNLTFCRFLNTIFEIKNDSE